MILRSFYHDCVHLIANEQKMFPQQEVLQHRLHRGHVLRGVVEERLWDLEIEMPKNFQSQLQDLDYLSHSLSSGVERRRRGPQVELPVGHAADYVRRRILLSVRSM